jgi:hypothetical protein
MRYKLKQKKAKPAKEQSQNNQKSNELKTVDVKFYKAYVGCFLATIKFLKKYIF